MPTKRQATLEQRGVPVRNRAGIIQQQKKVDEDRISLDYLKQEILKLEALYTDASTNYSREWAFKKTRDKVRDQIVSAENAAEVA